MPNGHNKPSIGNNRNRKRKTTMNFVSANQGIRIPGFRVTLLDSYQNFYLTGRFQSEFHSQLCGTARSLNLKSLTAKFVFLHSRLPHLPSNTALIIQNMARLLDIAPEISFSFLASIALIPKFNSTYRCTIENEYLCIRIKSFASLREQKANSIFESQKYNKHIFIARHIQSD